MITEKRNKIFDSSYSINEDGCWIWHKLCDKGGYAKTSFRKSKKLSCRISAHHYSYVRFKEKIPLGYHVCHNCPNGDKRNCVNPDHLWIGSSLENNRDKNKKGTQTKGETSGQNKLTENNVLEIRRRFLLGEYGTDLAKEFNVSSGLIYHIKNGKAWKYCLKKGQGEKLKKIKKNKPVKLNVQKVKEMRILFEKGLRVTDLSKMFDIQTTMVSRIINRKAWKHIL
jgi:Mor family transcriptional regulator